VGEIMKIFSLVLLLIISFNAYSWERPSYYCDPGVNCSAWQCRDSDGRFKKCPKTDHIKTFFKVVTLPLQLIIAPIEAYRNSVRDEIYECRKAIRSEMKSPRLQAQALLNPEKYIPECGTLK
jgi:hypothetical protein